MTRADPATRLVALSVAWLFTMGAVGTFFPFYSLYLRREAGLTGTEVGMVMAILPLVGLVMQPFWGHLADRSGARTRIFALVAAGSALGYAGVGLADGFARLAAATAALALFGVALVPSLVSVSLALTSDTSGTLLGRVRVWGTIGFGVTVGGFPFAMRAFEDLGLGLMFRSSALCVAVAAVVALFLPRPHAATLRAARGETRGLLRNGPFLRALSFGFFCFLFLQGPMALFPVLVHAQGGGVEALSRMWLLMLALEVPLVRWLGVSVTRLGHRGVIALGLAGASLRWLLSGTLEDLRWVTAVQMLHGLGVWGVILGIPMYVDAVVPERLRSSGQALLAMIAFSLGGFVSNLVTGRLIDAYDATTPARIGGVCGLLLVSLIPLWLAPVPPRAAAGLPAQSPSSQ